MLDRLRTFLEMIKFSHTIFALPFALLAAALASRQVGGWRPLDVIGILACMVTARTAAMGFNRWADRALDAKNPRTSNRAIPAGQLPANQVLQLTILSGLAFIASTAIFVASSGNWWPLMLSMPVLSVLLGYSYAKRFTPLAHLWLGVALGISPIAAWLAIAGNLTWTPILLGLAVTFWVFGFDIIYACQDIDTDRKQGLRSIPAWLGYERSMWVARLSHGVMIVSLIALGWITPQLSVFYWVGVAGVASLLAVEHWLVRGRDLQHINIAFFQVNGVISIALLAVTLVDLYR